MRKLWYCFLSVLIGTVCSASAEVLPRLDLSSAQGYPGDRVGVCITLRNPALKAIVGTNNDIRFDPAVVMPVTQTARLGRSGQLSDKQLYVNLIDNQTCRIAVLGFNTTVIPEGEIACIDFAIAENAPPGAYLLRNTPTATGSGSNPGRIQILAYAIEVTGDNGTITVLSPQSTTTTTASSGGGGGSQTTSLPPPTTTTTISGDDGGGGGSGGGSQTTTTTVYIPECSNDAECDDRVFCNGAEQCIDGVCVSGTPPCADNQTCREDKGECYRLVKVSGKCRPATIRRPFFLAQRCGWLLIGTEGKNNFNAYSAITFLHQDHAAMGFGLNPYASPLGMGTYILLPFCVTKKAETGLMFITITSEATADGESLVEIIESPVTIQ